MGTVQVNTNSGVLNFTIKGDTPTPVEQMRIQKILREQSLKNTRTSERKKAEQMFDYRTGIQNNELRRKLSRAENAE